MHKQNIENRMLILLRNGGFYRVIDNYLVAYDGGGFMTLDSYDDDLKNVSHGICEEADPQWDMMKITEPLVGGQLTTAWSAEDLMEDHITWERSDVNWDTLPLVEQTDELGNKRLIKCTAPCGDIFNDVSFKGIVLWDEADIHEIGYISTAWNKDGCKVVTMTHYDLL